jgi:uncharacterized protein YqiB (DUF1249 family)
MGAATGSPLRRRRYVPDLSEFMAECELNYLRLTKLLAGGARRRVLRLSDSHQFVLAVEEDGRYTSAVSLKQTLGEAMNALVIAELSVRLYHDARLAEVVACSGMRRLRGVYAYPNRWMAQPDEKAQLNLFLGECLRECLRHGYEPVPVGPA